MDTQARGGVGDILLTAIAPLTWATTYLITALWLPPDRPLFSAAVRALPVGLALLVWRRTLPRGDWWWKSALIGFLTIGAFFALLFVGAYRLPGGLAATLQATGPLAAITMNLLFFGRRSPRAAVLGGVVGAIGVAMLVLQPGFAVDALGVAAALGSVGLSTLGYLLLARWDLPVDAVTFTGWQMTWGGLMLAPLAFAIEGAPPALDAAAIVSYAWLAIVGAGVANLVWLRGLRRLGPVQVLLIGLVNPLFATILGAAFNGERFLPLQYVGMALVVVGVVLGQPAAVDRLARRLRRG